MSDQDDLFGGETTPQAPAVKFEELVGEDKKYKTQDDAAKALVEKDRFIEQLKRENAEAREALLKRNNEEEFLTRLESIARPKSPEPQEPPAEPRDEPAQSAITPADVDKLLDEREAKRLRQANLKIVLDRLQELYGDDYKTRVQSQAKVLKVTTDFLTETAAKSPEAFYRLTGLDVVKENSFSPPPRPSINMPSGPTSNRKDYKHYQKLREEKGESWYFSIPVQQEIWKAAKEAESRGEKFLP